MRTSSTLKHRGSSYEAVLSDVISLLEAARRSAARAVNAALTATYWDIGRRIVEEEQGGRKKAGYGDELLTRLSRDLAGRFGRGFGRSNLFQMRAFYLEYRDSPPGAGPAKVQTLSGQFTDASPTRRPRPRFPLPWSHYARLLTIKNRGARRFYEVEALRGGWTIRQLDRQIDSQFYERTALSRNKTAMLEKGKRPRSSDAVTPEEEIKDPYVLEFLGLKDEYSETEAEAALIARLESFLLELGGDFTFVGRQRRLRVGDDWYRVDLVFFHRTLRCLVIIDLKVGTFTHADSGQMHLYLNYARENWMRPGENPPVGLILCARKNDVLAHYALDGLPNKVLAAEYRTTLPEERMIAEELTKARSNRAVPATRRRRPTRT